MAHSAMIFDIRQEDFDSLVLENSHQLPVILEFMGIYSGPCVNLEQTLSEFAKEFAGQFIFAKVDIDEQPELAKQFDIQNVPTTFVMQKGEIVEAVEGLLQPEEVGTLLRGLGIYRQSDDLREQARQVYLQGEIARAIELLTQAAQMDPRNPRVAMDMVQVMIDLDQLEQATAIFNQLPDKEKQSEMGKALVGQLTFKQLAAKTAGKDALIAQLEQAPEQLDSRFDLALCLVAEHDYQGAMAQLVEIYRTQADYKEGAAREMMVSLANMLEANEPALSAKFRRQLANLTAA